MSLLQRLVDRLRKASRTRLIVYGALSAVILYASVYKVYFLHRVSQFKAGVDHLRFCFHQDSRFANVHISFSPTAPNVFILAPINLDPKAKADLQHVVTISFKSLSAPIYYVAP